MTRPALAFAAAAITVLALPAAAQRSRCGFGSALEALRQAGTTLAAASAPTSLADGRNRAGEAAAQLRSGEEGLARCACHRAAAEASDAAMLAEQALSEASVPALAAALRQARFRLALAQQRLGREGCD